MRTLASLLFFSTIAFGADCSVDGAVVDSVTGVPIARSNVTANKNASVLTDSSGKWTFPHLPCGEAAFTASRPTFLAEKTALNLNLVAETPLHDVKLRLIPQSVVNGRILDDFGDPIAGVQVVMMSPLMIDGHREMVFGGGSGVSNDVGEYRVAGLSGGKHVFCANPGIRAVRARNSEAPYGEQCTSPIVLAPGFNTSVDFQLHSVPPRHVRGVISGGPDGATPQIVLDCNSGTYSGGVGADRRFDIVSLAYGTCSLIASGFDETDRLTATRQVELGSEDIEGLHLHLEKSLTIAGTVRTYPTAGLKPDLSKFSVFPLPTSQHIPGNTQTTWSDDRAAFTFTNITPGNYRLQFGVMPPFYVRSATMAGRDVAHSEFTAGPGAPDIDVILSDDGGVLEGDVSGDDHPTVAGVEEGAPRLTLVDVLYGDDHPTVAGVLVQRSSFQHWFGKADSKGHFKIEGLPPGDYQVSAWDDIGLVEYANSAWMQVNARSVAASVQASQTTQVKLVRQIAPPE